MLFSVRDYNNLILLYLAQLKSVKTRRIPTTLKQFYVSLYCGENSVIIETYTKLLHQEWRKQWKEFLKDKKTQLEKTKKVETERRFDGSIQIQESEDDGEDHEVLSKQSTVEADNIDLTHEANNSVEIMAETLNLTSAQVLTSDENIHSTENITSSGVKSQIASKMAPSPMRQSKNQNTPSTRVLIAHLMIYFLHYWRVVSIPIQSKFHTLRIYRALVTRWAEKGLVHPLPEDYGWIGANKIESKVSNDVKSNGMGIETGFKRTYKSQAFFENSTSELGIIPATKSAAEFLYIHSIPYIKHIYNEFKSQPQYIETVYDKLYRLAAKTYNYDIFEDYSLDNNGPNQKITESWQKNLTLNAKQSLIGDSAIHNHMARMNSEYFSLKNILEKEALSSILKRNVENLSSFDRLDDLEGQLCRKQSDCSHNSSILIALSNKTSSMNVLTNFQSLNTLNQDDPDRTNLRPTGIKQQASIKPLTGAFLNLANSALLYFNERKKYDQVRSIIDVVEDSFFELVKQSKRCNNGLFLESWAAQQLISAENRNNFSMHPNELFMKQFEFAYGIYLNYISNYLVNVGQADLALKIIINAIYLVSDVNVAEQAQLLTQIGKTDFVANLNQAFTKCNNPKKTRHSYLDNFASLTLCTLLRSLGTTYYFKKEHVQAIKFSFKYLNFLWKMRGFNSNRDDALEVLLNILLTSFEAGMKDVFYEATDKIIKILSGTSFLGIESQIKLYMRILGSLLIKGWTTRTFAQPKDKRIQILIKEILDLGGCELLGCSLGAAVFEPALGCYAHQVFIKYIQNKVQQMNQLSASQNQRQFDPFAQLQNVCQINNVPITWAPQADVDTTRSLINPAFLPIMYNRIIIQYCSVVRQTSLAMPYIWKLVRSFLMKRLNGAIWDCKWESWHGYSRNIIKYGVQIGLSITKSTLNSLNWSKKHKGFLDNLKLKLSKSGANANLPNAKVSLSTYQYAFEPVVDHKSSQQEPPAPYNLLNLYISLLIHGEQFNRALFFLRIYIFELMANLGFEKFRNSQAKLVSIDNSDNFVVNYELEKQKALKMWRSLNSPHFYQTTSRMKGPQKNNRISAFPSSEQLSDTGGLSHQAKQQCQRIVDPHTQKVFQESKLAARIKQLRGNLLNSNRELIRK